jgi:hypothetical protein
LWPLTLLLWIVHVVLVRTASSTRSTLKASTRSAGLAWPPAGAPAWLSVMAVLFAAAWRFAIIAS